MAGRAHGENRNRKMILAVQLIIHQGVFTNSPDNISTPINFSSANRHQNNAVAFQEIVQHTRLH